MAASTYLLFLTLGVQAAAGIALFAIALYKIAFSDESPYQFRWIIVFIASLQWVIAPSMMYNLGVDLHERYRMYVPEDVYFELATPGFLAFALGLILFSSRRETKIIHDALSNTAAIVRRWPSLPILFLAAGFLATPVAYLLPASIAFVVVLVSYFKFTGLLLLLLTDRVDKWLWISATTFLMVVEAAATSIFHSTLLWFLIIGVFYTWLHRPSAFLRVLIISSVAFSGLVIQSMKHEYRADAWTGGDRGAAIFVDMGLERAEEILSGEVDPVELGYGTLVRLNQGWIISSVMMHTPYAEPFARGETLEVAGASLVPRVLWPNKPDAGGRENFERFTGLQLHGSTSMNISLLGEGYANFGVTGAPVFLFIAGALISIALKICVMICRRYSVLIVLLPIVMFQALKAETDTLTILNHVVKASALMVLGAIIIDFIDRQIQNRRRKRPRRTYPLPSTNARTPS